MTLCAVLGMIVVCCARANEDTRSAWRPYDDDRGELPVDVLRDLKIRALQEGRGLSDLAAEIIAKYLATAKKWKLYT